MPRPDLEAKATRWLARRAREAGAIDVLTWDAIDEDPDCAVECAEFLDWLSGGADVAA